MATYKGIQGYTVQNLSSDPTASEVEGQLWYNSASNVWKVSVGGAAAWATGGNMTTGRNRCGGTGPGTSAIAVGGYPPGGAPTVSLTETYNGTAWTEVTNIPIAPGWPGIQDPGFAGTSTAALFISGDQGPSPTNTSLTYNGSSWSAAGSRNNVSPTISLLRVGGAGTETDCLTTCGETIPNTPGGPGGNRDVTESYNGTAWTELAVYPAVRNEVEITGSTSAAIAAGGYNGAGPDPVSATTVVNEWDGSSWASGTSMTNGRAEAGSFHNSPTTDWGVFAGTSPSSGKTELWNGTSWTETADLTGRTNQMMGGGTTSSGIAAGGGWPTSNVTEIFNKAPFAAKTVTTS